MAELAGKSTITEKKMFQTINIAKELGIKDAPARLVQEFGQAIVDKIVDRTGEGKGVGGEKLTPKYSDAYKDSEEYKDAGKTGKVNMTLTGDMLDSVDFTQTKQTVKVSVGAGETAKGYNHQVGDTLPERQWFGVTDKELKSIKRDFKDDVRRIKEEKTTARQQARQAVDLATVSLVEGQTPRQLFDDVFANLFEVSDGEN